MKIEDQVCSLELSKRLKELGVKQESCFSWENITNCGYVISYDPPVWDDMYSAFTVAELGEILNNFKFTIIYWYTGEEWMCADRIDGLSFIDKNDKKEADMRAKMLIHLIKKGRVKAEDL